MPGTFGYYDANERAQVDGASWLGPLMVLAGSYLLGSIPFGIIVTRLGGAGDLRTIGSGNIGATNVLRTGRRGLAAATLLLDALKGALAVLIALWVAPDSDTGAAFAALAATGVFFGHLYPVWLRFRGGKGVATLLGVALALSWPCGVAFAFVWLVALLVSRYSSIGGMLAAVTLPVVAAALGRFDLVLLFLAFALLVLWKHGGNIARLIAGTEPRLGQAAADLPSGG